MPSVSRSQQRLFALVRQVQQGKLTSPSGKLSQIAKSISPDDAKHFAETKHDKLPEKASLDKTVEKAPYLEKQMTMDGVKKQAFDIRPRPAIGVANTPNPALISFLLNYDQTYDPNVGLSLQQSKALKKLLGWRWYHTNPDELDALEALMEQEDALDRANGQAQQPQVADRLTPRRDPESLAQELDRTRSAVDSRVAGAHEKILNTSSKPLAKQAVTRRSWDDARFESVVGALSKVKVPKVKKPQKEEQTVDMNKSAYSTEAWDQLLKSLRTGGSPAALAGGLGVLGTGALGMGSALAGTGALAGAAYGAGQAPDKQKVRGAVQGVLPGAGAGFGLGAGTVGGTGLGGMLGMLLANKLKDNPTLALAAMLGSTIGGAGLGGYAGLKAGKGLGKAITKPILGAPVDRANPAPEMKQAGCGGKKKKKSKKGK